MSTPGSKSVHLAKTTPGEVEPTQGRDAGNVNDDQSITEPLPLPEASTHQSGQRTLLGIAAPERAREARENGAPLRFPKTSLLEWLELIEAGRRDAVITIETRDGTEGRIFCTGGEIVDAECGPLAGAMAADRLLSIREGDFSVSFSAVQRPRAISSTAGVLLLEEAHQNVSSAVSPAHALTLVGDSPLLQDEITSRRESQAPIAPSERGSGLHSDMPVARTNRPSAAVSRYSSRHSPYIAGALVGAAIGLTVWQWSASKWQWSSSGQKRQAAAQELRPVTVQPIADSRLAETPVNVGDGLPFVADEPVLAGGGDRMAKPGGDRQRHARTEVVRVRRASTPLPSPRPSGEEARRNDAAKTKVQSADAQKPKIQIIEPLKPRIQIIEPLKPKVQIIEPLKSKPDPAEGPQVKPVE